MLIRKINKPHRVTADFDIFMYCSVHVFPLVMDQGTFFYKFLRKFVSLLKKLKTNCINSADICQVQLRPD